MSFATRLRQARKEAGLSQAELAGDRCSLSYVSHLESGRRAPTADLIRYFETRLDLPRGTLGSSADVSPTDQRRGEEVEPLARYLDALSSWRTGAFGRALEQASTLAASPALANRADLKWLTTALLVDIETDLGHYSSAMEQGAKLRDLASTFSNNTLTITAALAASRAARLAGHAEDARTAAVEASHVAAEPGTSVHLRAEALTAAIASLDADKAQVDELKALYDSLDDSHTKGRAAWSLGIHDMRSGAIDAGLAWFDDANANLSAIGNFRDWARLPRAQAAELMAAHRLGEVPQLLAEARRRISLLNAPDEIATLAMAEADFMALQGDRKAAIAHLNQQLSDEDLPALTAAHLHRDIATHRAASGDVEGARAASLEAARLFTVAGAITDAQEAWTSYDAFGHSPAADSAQ